MRTVGRIPSEAQGAKDRGTSRLARRLFALFLVAHGFAHLVGTTSSLNAIDKGTSASYLAGAWDVSGPNALRVLAILWALGALGYLVAAVAMWSERPWRRAALVVVSAFSLALSVAGIWAAVIGAVIDVALVGLALPRRGPIHRALFA